MSKKLKYIIEDKITHTTEKGDKKGTTMSGAQTTYARCVGYDRDRRIVVVINPFGKMSSFNKANDPISDVTRQIMTDYSITNLVEIPWTPQSGNDNEVDPGEALEGGVMAGVKEMEEDEITFADMWAYLIYLKMEKELSLKEFVTAVRMIDEALAYDEYEEEEKPPKLNEIVVEIQYTQLTWPQKAKCIRVVTTDPVEQTEHVAKSVPKGSDVIDTAAEETQPHDPVNLDRVVDDVDKLLEKVGSESDSTTTTDRTLGDEIERRANAGFSNLPSSQPITGLPVGGGSGISPGGQQATGASSPSYDFSSGEGQQAISDMSSGGTVNSNIYEGDDAPLYRPFTTVTNLNPHNVARPSDSSSWGSKNDPQEPMLTMLKGSGLLSKRNRAIVSSIPKENVVNDVALINPVSRGYYISTLANFGVTTLMATGTEVNNPGILVRTRASAPIVASASGVVSSIKHNNGYASIVIKHNNSISTEYGNILSDSISIKENQWINAGRIIGLVHNTANIYVFKFAVTVNGGNEDPLKYIPGWKT